MRLRPKISHTYITKLFKIAIYLEWNFKKKENEFTFRAKTHCKKNVKLLSTPVRSIRVLLPRVCILIHITCIESPGSGYYLT